MDLSRNHFQRNSSWNAPFTFSGKEKDAEIGYGYVKKLRFFSSLAFGNEKQVFHYAKCLRRFGARYYDSGLSVWLSVDPLSDKYPTLSPYTYCANNPIMMVDPDGRKFLIFGEKAQKFINQLNNYTGLELYITGNEVKYKGISNGSKLDEMLIEVIDSDIINVQITYGVFTGGSCLGAHYTPEDKEKGRKESATGKQGVDPDILAEMDANVGDSKPGGYAVHEFAEGYYNAKIALRRNKSSLLAQRDEFGNYPKGSTYLKAHRRANKIMGGGYHYDGGLRLDYDNPIITTDFFGKTTTTINAVKYSDYDYQRTRD